jgi:hypothetical protein
MPAGFATRPGAAAFTGLGDAAGFAARFALAGAAAARAGDFAAFFEGLEAVRTVRPTGARFEDALPGLRFGLFFFAAMRAVFLRVPVEPAG